MANRMRSWIWVLLATMLVLGGCGRKEAPQIIHESQPPQLVDLHYELTGMSLKLDFKLTGSPEGVGYQIDRAAIDPYCKCPDLWRRYMEQLPIPQNVGVSLTKMLRLRTPNTEYAFRIRAFDAAGQLGPWSKHMRATGVDLFNQ